MNVNYVNDKTVTFSAETYISSMEKKYLPKPIEKYPSYTIPADDNLLKCYEDALLRKHEPSTELMQRFGSLVGALIYAVPCGRPDVAYAVGVCARALTFPTEEMYACAVRVLVFLIHTKREGTTLSGNAPDASRLRAYSDADWHVTHSTTGWAAVLAGGAVAYGSKRQHCISLSSTESEIMAASQTACEIIYLRELMAFIGLPQPDPTPLFIDNKSVVALSHDYSASNRSRHILRRWFKIREMRMTGEIDTRSIPTDDNPADTLTKALSRVKFAKFRSQLMQLPKTIGRALMAFFVGY
jgi:hypothetical protein